MQIKTNYILKPLSILFLIFFSSACSTTRESHPESILTLLEEEGTTNDQLSPNLRRAIQEIEDEILEANSEIESSSVPEKPHIPIEVNENVRKWIYFFTVKDRDRFERFLKRGNIYKKLVHDILEKNGVPTDLYYLAMIESGYVTHARSRARAVGAWQFISATGKRYGLSQSSDLDERRDIVRSTEAAAKYLNSLHKAFQSWYLAMAGYNAGERRILGAVMRGGSRDFWTLVDKKVLPRETRNYVPKFLAAKIIGKHPEKYGFTDTTSDETFPEFESVAVPGGVKLEYIAAKSSIPLDTLKLLNPHLVRNMTPRNYKSYPIWTPAGSAEIIAQNEVYFNAHRLNYSSSRSIASSGSHRVRRGENLITISKKYNVSVFQLKRKNRLRSNRILIGQRLKIPSHAQRNKKYHSVRSGDALVLISRKYGISVSKLKQLNNIDNNLIYVGQKLLVNENI